MYRFFLSPEQCSGDVLELSDSEAHHALKVLRLRPGDPVTVLDGVGHTYRCQIGEATKRTLRLGVISKEFTSRLPCQVTLFQALPKPKAMDYIVQKATELGVARIVPVLTERVISHLDDKAASEKPAKLLPVALEAIKQCGSPWLPTIESPLSLQMLLARMEQIDLSFVASLQPGARHLKELVADFNTVHQPPATAAVWVGPEGDFTPNELEQILGSGARPISCGPLVLRSDTAAIYCLSVLNHELQPK